MIGVSLGLRIEDLERLFKLISARRWTSGRVPSPPDAVHILSSSGCRADADELQQMLVTRGFGNPVVQILDNDNPETEVLNDLIRATAESWGCILVASSTDANGNIGRAFVELSRKRPDLVLAVASRDELSKTPLARYERLRLSAGDAGQAGGMVRMLTNASLQRLQHLKSLCDLSGRIVQLMVVLVVLAGVGGFYLREHMARTCVNEVQSFDAAYVTLSNGRSLLLASTQSALPSSPPVTAVVSESLSLQLVDVEFLDALRDVPHVWGGLRLYLTPEAAYIREATARFIGRESHARIESVHLKKLRQTLDGWLDRGADPSDHRRKNPVVPTYASFRVLAEGDAARSLVGIELKDAMLCRLGEESFLFAKKGALLVRPPAGSASPETLMVLNAISRATKVRVFGVSVPPEVAGPETK